MKWQIYRLIVRAENIGQRLDLYLAAVINDMSRTKAKKIIDLGGVHINGRRVRSSSSPVKLSDSIEVYVDQLPLDPYRIDSNDIVFQDSYIIVINKPPQVDTQPTHARFKGTMYEALQWHLRDPFKLHLKADIGMVQRLDRGTSGLMVFFFFFRAHKEMTRIFLDHEVSKRYIALVHNVPATDRGEIKSLLARSRKENRVKSVAKGGKEAITNYEVSERFIDYSLLNVEILTGRSHQIRAHMAEQNCPLAGDVRYGGSKLAGGIEIARPLLHAETLVFKHPVLHDLLSFKVPIATDMQNIINQLRVS